MNLATVSANGQITVPVEIRRRLNLKAGDKLLFLRKQNGEIVVNNTTALALQTAQEAVAGSQFSEDEVLAEVMDIRYGDR
ncbi:MAG: AbrB/MazE/SpoVT family DNA-binding domain-containing protein [Coriobacteriia bacterium]|nr:AbrB/MazE/SpoVT family DNA-binding domain-containing protein [Coriobacteriia bacterium]MCL2537302.1 AbrB/MazE/SpoVT family DNA-binding domain-containing protein [Coriobacteriia bacterium]